jgi:ribosomal protein L11 methylase PrmA
LRKQATVWGDYYNNTNYSGKGLKDKEEIISGWISKTKPKTIWDAGANDGFFSRLGSKQKIFTVASDIDPIAVEHAYIRQQKEQDEFLLPLIVDLTNPSPAIGWSNCERDSFLSRGKFDLALCLAFIHHLAIANNLPFAKIAELFSAQANNLIIEFVPKTDSNAQRLLSNREDIFAEYDQKNFEKEFSNFFKIKKSSPVKGSKRILYLMGRKN